jgi:hypothetical protein
MIETYIKNKGITKSFSQNNNEKKTNELSWDTDYDGNVSNISLHLNNNGKHKNYNFSLNNDDLANMLNIDSINVPLEQRLKRDFKKKPKMQQIELDANYMHDLNADLDTIKKTNYLSSPKINEEFIIPLTIDEIIEPKKHHKKHKTHKTYKVYKHKKTPSNRSKSRTSKRKSSTVFSLI